MIGITLAVLLEASRASLGWQDYATAYRLMQNSGRPMVVVVSAEWCPPCRQMKRDVFPNNRIKQLLGSYSCARIDVDQNPSLAQKITGGEGMPFVAVYVPEGDGWKRRTRSGYQSVESLARFLQTD